jgi:parallel beta-helix repeat protein
MNIRQHMRCIGFVMFGMVLAGSFLGAQLADAATYYAATTGNDANPGTEASPFRTINRGVKVLKPGDILRVKSGTYAEALRNTIPGGTSWSSPVTVAAAPGHTVTIRPPAGSTNVLRFENLRKYIEVQGFILDGVNITSDAIKITYGGSSNANAAHHIRIRDCEVKNAASNGILVSGGSDNNEFINLKVHDNGENDYEHGFYISSANNVVENSEVYRNGGWGVHVYKSGGTAVNNNIIRNNKIYDNGQAGNHRGVGIILASGSGNMAYNNLIWGNKEGISVSLGASNSKVYHNTVYGNISGGIFIRSGSTNAQIRNNIAYGNGGPQLSNTGSGTLLSNNLVDVDPKFVNAGAADFRLQSSSPAVNKGVTLSEVPKDYAGVSRPQGGSHDIGGYEYTGSTVSASVTAPMNLRIVDSQ